MPRHQADLVHAALIAATVAAGVGARVAPEIYNSFKTEPAKTKEPKNAFARSDKPRYVGLLDDNKVYLKGSKKHVLQYKDGSKVVDYEFEDWITAQDFMRFLRHIEPIYRARSATFSWTPENRNKIAKVVNKDSLETITLEEMGTAWEEYNKRPPEKISEYFGKLD